MKRCIALVLATMLAGAGAAVAAGAGYKSGTYTGHLNRAVPGEHAKITLVVSGRTLKSVRYSALFDCVDQQNNPVDTTTQSTTLPATAIKNGKVNKEFKLYGGSDLIQLKVTFKGKQAKGTVSEAYESAASHICSTDGPVNFSASTR